MRLSSAVINTSTGGLTKLGAIGQSASDATSDAGGQMFVLSQDLNANLYTLNPPSPAANVVGQTGLTNVGLAAVNSAGTSSHVGYRPEHRHQRPLLHQHHDRHTDTDR